MHILVPHRVHRTKHHVKILLLQQILDVILMPDAFANFHPPKDLDLTHAFLRHRLGLPCGGCDVTGNILSVIMLNVQMVRYGKA